jgi:hypothetical protein
LFIDLVRATSASSEVLDLAVLILDLALVDKLSEIRLQNVAAIVILEAVWMLDEILDAVIDRLLPFVHRSVVYLGGDRIGFVARCESVRAGWMPMGNTGLPVIERISERDLEIFGHDRRRRHGIREETWASVVVGVTWFWPRLVTVVTFAVPYDFVISSEVVKARLHEVKFLGCAYAHGLQFEVVDAVPGKVKKCLFRCVNRQGGEVVIGEAAFVSRFWAGFL